ncbi:hypothetical protein [Streptomyces sp. NPDC058295]|uniref:hypothetical protein n=1 Tax=Streptomyces sp. NPDC058295 TaxID=3346431 RepID=UPI0036DFFCAD
MSSAHRIDPLEEEARPQLTGAWSLMLGSMAVVAIDCPTLPESVPNQPRYSPVYRVPPVGAHGLEKLEIEFSRSGKQCF